MIGYLRGQDRAILVTAITFPQSPSGPGAQIFFSLNIFCDSNKTFSDFSIGPLGWN